MRTFLKAKIKKSDDETNIDKYRVAVNITKYHIISSLESLFQNSRMQKAIISCKNCM